MRFVRNQFIPFFLFPLIVIIGILFVFRFEQVVAAGPFTTDFSTYAPGDLLGQDSWTDATGNTDTSIQVVSDPPCIYSVYCVTQDSSNPTTGILQKMGTPQTSGVVDFYLYIAKDSPNVNLYLSKDSSTYGTYRMSVGFQNQSSGVVKVVNQVGGFTQVNDLQVNHAYTARFTFDLGAGTPTACFEIREIPGSQSCINVDTGVGAGFGSVSSLGIRNEGSRTTSKKLYLTAIGSDNISFSSLESHFISVTPAHHSTQSTSSPITVGFTAFVNEDDVGNHFRYQIFPVNTHVGTGSIFGVLGGDTSSYGYWDIEATSSGFFTWSTTTDRSYPQGTYNSSVELDDLCFTVLGKTYCPTIATNSNLLLIATSTFWNAASSSQLGRDFEETTSFLNDIYSGSSASSTAQYCGIINFDLRGCLAFAFVPSAADLSHAMTTLKDQFLLRAPWGYVTRFVQIMTLTAEPVEPPALTYTFGSSSPPALQGRTVSFQIWDNASIITEARSDDGQNKNLWEIVDPFFTMVVAFGVLFIILADILGIQFVRDSEWVLTSDEEATIEKSYVKNDYYDTTPREWQNMKDNRLL